MSQPSDTPLVAGDRLNDYELLCPIGEGGMATVWVARLSRKRGFEKLVAIKTILAHHAEDESFQEMFFDEAQIASRIEHPNVAHVHDLGEEQERGVVFLVMEYIDGHALTLLRKTLLRERRAFPIGVAARIMADVCAGLQAAHDLRNHDGTSLGVVHRDVSPQNVLISTVGVSKLIDFGVAKAVNRLASRTSTGYVKGKVQYMAPEQALAKDVDHRADVWGVGAVLYTLITGRYPYDEENHLAHLSRLQRKEPPPPLPSSVPLPIAAIIERALSFEPGERFASADAMRVALEGSGHIASHREVATFVQDVLGKETEKRRNALNAARAAADARAREPAPPEEDLDNPTMPNAKAPRFDENAVTMRKPRPGLVMTMPTGNAPPEIQRLREAAAAKLASHPPSGLTPVMPSAPEIIIPNRRKSIPDVTARMDPPSLTPRPSRVAISSQPSIPDVAFATGPIQPHELAELRSRTGYGMASGGSYSYVPAPTAPALAPKKSAGPIIAIAVAALLVLAGVGSFIAMRGVLSSPPDPVLSSPPPTSPSPAPLPSALIIVPAPSAHTVRTPTTQSEAAAALLKGDAEKARKLLQPLVRSGEATPEEANMLKQACKMLGDRACVDEIKAKYPNL